MAEEQLEFIGNAIDPAPSVHPRGGVSMTKQAEKDSADINVIVERHIAANVPIFPDGRARYGDFSNFGDYHSCLNSVMKAEDDFMKLPAKVRDACENDVGILLDKIATREGLEELKKLGLDGAMIPEDVADGTTATEEVSAPDGAHS